MTNITLTEEYRNSGRLLQNGDPAPYILKKGDSPFIFTGPHNGIAVPQLLMLEPKWLGRHESHDLGMKNLFAALQNIMPEANFLSGTYSRLVADLNRKPDTIVEKKSTEYEDEIIEMNDGLTGAQWQQRHDEVYAPYIETQAALIEEVKNRFGYAVLLDLHSFAPTWQGAPRGKLLGTLRLNSANTVGQAIDRVFRDKLGKGFAPGFPYPQFEESKTNNGGLITNRHGIDYNIVEIRHDQLKAQDHAMLFAFLIREAALHAETAVKSKLQLKTERRPEPPAGELIPAGA